MSQIGAAPQQLQKLRYRLLYISSHDPDYPPTELLSLTPSTKGWQSQRFCQYPQEIEL